MQPGFYLRLGSSSLLLILTFPRPDAGFVSFVALVPLLAALKGAGAGRAFLAGWGAGAAWFFVSYNWVTHSLTVFGNIPLPVSEGIILLLAAIHGLYVGLFALLVPAVAARNSRDGGGTARGGRDRLSGIAGTFARAAGPILVLPSAWVLLELARSWVPAPFPWLLMGTAAWKMSFAGPLFQFAGVHGVSFWIVAINAAIWVIMETPQKGRPAPAFILAGLAILPLALLPVSRPPAGQTLRVGIVQGNFEQELKWEESLREETLETYLSLTAQAVEEGARLVVWPETAIPSFYQAEPELMDRLRNFTARHNVHLIFGSPGYEIVDREILLYNRVYHLPPRGGEAFYDKIMLVPFGEYIPFPRLLPFVDKMVPGEGEFSRGAWERPFRTPVPSGALVCYEISIPSLARREVHDGSSILINVTNDAWFGRSWGPYQHLAVSAVRAMENSVPVLRAANTGISAVIDRNGQVAETIALQRRGVIVRDIETGGGLTLYTRFGDWIVILCAAVLVVYCLAIFTPWRSRKWTA